MTETEATGRRRLARERRRRCDPAARRPPPRRVAAPARSTRGATRSGAAWRSSPSCAGTWTTSTRSMSAAGSRSSRSDEPTPGPERFARELPDLLGGPARRPPADAPGDRARPRARRAVGLARGARPPRPRARRPPGRHRCRDDRAHPARPVRRPASDRGAHLARARPGRGGDPGGPADAPTSSRPGRRARSASRPMRSASTTCRRSAAATSWRSATPAPTPPRWRRPTTAGLARRRSSSIRTATCASPAPRAPDSTRIASILRSMRRLAAVLNLAAPRPSCWPASRTPRHRRRRPPTARAALSRTPSTARPVYDYAGLPSSPRRAPRRADRRRHRGADEGRGRRLHPGARARRHHDRGGRDARGRPDGPMGRRAPGIDDGLVILFDLDTTLKHGQVQLLRRVRASTRPTFDRRAPGDLRGRHAAAPARRATSTPRSASGCRRS